MSPSSRFHSPVFQRFVDSPLAVEVLAGRFHEGETIVVEPGGDTLRFKKDVPAAVAS